MKHFREVYSDNDNSLNKRMVIYYGIITVITILLMRPELELPMAFRLVYMALVFFPLYNATEYTTFVFTSFYTISYCSFVGLLPFSIGYPFVCLLVLWLVSGKKGKIPPLLIISSIYFFLISLLHFDFEQTGVLWFGILMAMILSNYVHSKKDITYLAYGFVTVAFVLSLVFLINRDAFMYSYTHSAEAMDRSGWMNPNDLGGTIGCGTVVSMGLLFNGEKKKLFFFIYLVITVLLSLTTLVVNASRGALLAVLIGGVFFIFLNTKISLFKKVIVVGLAGLFVYYLYNNDYLELLEVRIQEEAEERSGGSRYDIWSQKLAVFNEYDFISHVFGIGQLDCKEIGTRHIRTHNDFLTAYLAYGYIGLLLFIFSLLYPVYHRFSKKKTLDILPYMAFLLVECFVLEPIMRGYFVFIVFFLFICKKSSLYTTKVK